MSRKGYRHRSRRTLYERKGEEQSYKPISRKERIRNLIIYISILLIVFLIVFFIYISPDNSRDQSISVDPLYPPIDNISCDGLEHSDQHIHAHLTIYKDGQQVPVAPNIGISSSCFYWLHTHDDAGIIHVESPIQEKKTLGSFLRIWRERFADAGYDNQLSAPDGWSAYIDGELYTGDFNKIELTSHRLITLIYNSPDVVPVTEYNWPQELSQ